MVEYTIEFNVKLNIDSGEIYEHQSETQDVNGNWKIHGPDPPGDSL